MFKFQSGDEKKKLISFRREKTKLQLGRGLKDLCLWRKGETFNLIIFRMEREDQQNIKSFNGESWNSDEKMQQSL